MYVAQFCLHTKCFISQYIMYLLCWSLFTVPSCHVTTNCAGEPVNISITFDDCCKNHGVAYDLDGRCQPCPTRSKVTININALMNFRNYSRITKVAMYVLRMVFILKYSQRIFWMMKVSSKSVASSCILCIMFTYVAIMYHRVYHVKQS